MAKKDHWGQDQPLGGLAKFCFWQKAIFLEAFVFPSFLQSRIFALGMYCLGDMFPGFRLILGTRRDP